MSKIKISQLPTSTQTDGLYTIGVNANNSSVKVPIGELIDDKVDKVAGKQLSTNDYTNDEKHRLADIQDDTLVITYGQTPFSVIQQAILNYKYLACYETTERKAYHIVSYSATAVQMQCVVGNVNYGIAVTSANQWSKATLTLPKVEYVDEKVAAEATARQSADNNLSTSISKRIAKPDASVPQGYVPASDGQGDVSWGEQKDARVDDLENIANVRLEQVYGTQEFYEQTPITGYYAGSYAAATATKFVTTTSTIYQCRALPIEAGEWRIRGNVRSIYHADNFGVCLIPKVSDDFSADMALLPDVTKIIPNSVYAALSLSNYAMAPFDAVVKNAAPMWVVFNYMTTYADVGTQGAWDVYRIVRDAEKEYQPNADKTLNYDDAMAEQFAWMAELHGKQAMLCKMRPNRQVTYNGKTYTTGNDAQWYAIELNGGLTPFNHAVEEVAAARFTNSSYNPARLTGVEIVRLTRSSVNSLANISSMFSNAVSVKELNVSQLNVSSNTSFDSMFLRCASVERLDLSTWNTSAATWLANMFSNCNACKEIIFGAGWDTSNVTSMKLMFDTCNSLERLELSKFDTSKVTDFTGMFQYCQSLTSIDLSSFDTSSGQLFTNMFNGMSGLTELDVTNFDTRQLTNMGSMFMNCTGLRYLDLSSFDLSNCTSMANLFWYDYELRYVKVSAGFFNAQCTIVLNNITWLGFNEAHNASNGWIEEFSSVAPQLPEGTTKTISLSYQLKSASFAATYLTQLQNKGYTIA